MDKEETKENECVLILKDIFGFFIMNNFYRKRFIRKVYNSIGMDANLNSLNNITLKWKNGFKVTFTFYIVFFKRVIWLKWWNNP